MFATNELVERIAEIKESPRRRVASRLSRGLAKQYAEAKGISLRTAYFRLSHPERLDAKGDFIRHPRRDRGIAKRYTKADFGPQIETAKQLLRDKGLSLRSIARSVGLPNRLIAQMARDMEQEKGPAVRPPTTRPSVV